MAWVRRYICDLCGEELHADQDCPTYFEANIGGYVTKKDHVCPKCRQFLVKLLRAVREALPARVKAEVDTGKQFGLAVSLELCPPHVQTFSLNLDIPREVD